MFLGAGMIRTVPGEPIRPHSRTSDHSPNRVGMICKEQLVMTPLRLRMIEDMQIRNLAPRTQKSYIEQVARFAATLTSRRSTLIRGAHASGLAAFRATRLGGVRGQACGTVLPGFDTQMIANRARALGQKSKYFPNLILPTQYPLYR
jgi:hypothetical protein